MGFFFEVIQRFRDVASAQDKKGLEKYGALLNPAHEMNIEDKTYSEYDWLHMIEEEVVDGYKYIQMEKYRRESKREAIEDLTAKAITVLDEIKSFRKITEGTIDDIDSVKDLLEKVLEVNDR